MCRLLGNSLRLVCVAASLLHSSSVTFGVRWNLDHDLSKYTPRFNVAPETSPNVPVIIRQKDVNECRLMHFGWILHWGADSSIGNRMINARAETLTELPSFKLLVDRRHCIIPVDGFSEWRRDRKRSEKF